MERGIYVVVEYDKTGKVPKKIIDAAVTHGDLLDLLTEGDAAPRKVKRGTVLVDV